MIHPNTRILRQEVGYGRIGDVLDSFPVWTGDRVVSANLSIVEPSERVLVTLINGLQLVCSRNQKLSTKKGKTSLKLAVPASELTTKHLVRFTENTFEFDYFDKSCYNYLSKLDSEQIGTLMGLVYCLSATGRVLDVPRQRKESWKELERLLGLAGVTFEKEEYYKRTDRNKYTITDEWFLEEIQDLIATDSLPEKFWTSKLVLKGFLKVLFTFSIVRTESISVNAKKDTAFLLEVQQALLMFGINSSFCRGLKVSQLMLFDHNAYRLANNIGVFNGEILFQGLDYTRFRGYKDRTFNSMRYSKVCGVKELDSGRLFEIDSSQYMANGVILEN